MKEQTTSDSKPTKNNKKTKMIFIIILFIIISITDFLLIYNNIKMYKQIRARYDVKRKPSGLHMLIAEETYDTTYNENLKDKKTIYYFVFNKNGQCTACFATLINNEVIGGAKQGFINPRKIDDDTYVELPSYKVFTMEEINQMINNDPYCTKLAEW